MNIALDALGGDDAPRVTVMGALSALSEASARGEAGLEITLIGDRKKIRPYLPSPLPPELKILDIRAQDPGKEGTPATAGEDSSSPIRTALRMHHEGSFQAVVSAGPTAAQVIASLLELEKCHGITRPAIGSFLPTVSGQCFLIDVGASLVATPHHLVQFGAMGHVYVRELLGIAEPRIGLVNVGSEATVGERSVVEAYRLLEESGFNFVGNIEGRDILAGVADVVVCNGFVGNVLLKFAEGFPALLPDLQPLLSGETAKALRDPFDYHARGGEPLLGVKGVSIICHGASSERAIQSAIFQATHIVRLDLHKRIEEFLVDRFATYYSQVKYLRSFRRSLRLRGKTEDESGDQKTEQ